MVAGPGLHLIRTTCQRASPAGSLHVRCQSAPVSRSPTCQQRGQDDIRRAACSIRLVWGRRFRLPTRNRGAGPRPAKLPTALAQPPVQPSVTAHLPHPIQSLSPRNPLTHPLSLSWDLWRQAPLLVLTCLASKRLHSSGTELPAPLKGMRGPLTGRTLDGKDFGIPESITAGRKTDSYHCRRPDNSE